MAQLMSLAVGDDASVNKGLIVNSPGQLDRLFERQNISPVFFDHFQYTPATAGNAG
jgi:hypothetical protein